MDQTSLDAAAAEMARAGEGTPAAMRFYQTLAETALILLLDREADGQDLTPKLFDLPSGRLVLAFDSEDRLGAFAQNTGQGALPYAQIPGRVLAQMVAQTGGMGLGLNFGAGSASEMVLPSDAMAWLAEIVQSAPSIEAARIAAVLPSTSFPADLTDAVARGLAGAGGLAQSCYLASLRLTSGKQTTVLALFGTAPEAEAPIARAVAEAVAFSGHAGALDVIFLAPNAPLALQIQRAGHAIALPPAPQIDLPHQQSAPPAPGMDPNRPPNLR